MKTLNKTLLAAALMVAAGSANAAMTQGEAFLVAFDAGYVNTDATLGRTFNLDLGTTFTALKADASTALASFIGATNNLIGNAAWTTFTGAGSTSLITYGVYAAGDSTAPAVNGVNGVFVTGGPVAPAATAATTPAGSTTTWGSYITQIDRQGLEIGVGMGAASSSVIKGTDQAASGQAGGAAVLSAVWGGEFTGSVASTAAYGFSNDLFYGTTHLGSIVKRGTTTNGVALLAQSDINLVGAFTLAGNTLSFVSAAPVSAVPLPAAVWMFGAGLMGVLRLNRRKSVQA